MKKAIIILSVLLLPALFSFQEEKTISINLSIQETNIVLKALSKLPYEESASIISKIQAQAQAQLSDTTNAKK